MQENATVQHASYQPQMATRHGKYSWSELSSAAGWNNTAFQRPEGKTIECKIFLMSLLEKWNYICGSHLLLSDSTSCCCCLVTKSCPNLHDPMDCSTPGFPVLHYLPGFAQTHVHLAGDAIQPSHPVIPFSSCLQSFPASGSFLINQFFAWGGQSIGASVSASVLPVNIQDWFPLGLIGLISLKSKGLSRVFSSTIVQKYQFFGAQLSLWSNPHIHTWLLEKP